MEPVVTAALIAGAASAVGGGTQAVAQGKMNRKTREWNEKMYGIQRQHALEDWNRVNAYNSPEQQMQRYKEAGLNPHLIYGKGNESQAVRGTDVQAWKPEVPDYQSMGQNLGNSVGNYYDIKSKVQSTENAEKQNRNLDAQYQNMMADNSLKMSQLQYSTFRNMKEEYSSKIRGIDHARSLATYNSSVAAAKLANDKVQSEINKNDTITKLNDVKSQTEWQSYLQNQDRHPLIMEKIKQETNSILTKMREINQNINSLNPQRLRYMETQINNLEKSGKLTDLEVEMRKKGGTFNDNIFLRNIINGGKAFKEAWNLADTIDAEYQRFRKSKNKQKQ